MTTLAAPLAGSRPRANTLRTMLALTVRDLYVLRRQAPSLAARVILQPLLFVFVFAYVMPKIGSAGGGGLFAGGGRPGVPSFATVLVPGMLGITLAMQGIMAVTMPLMMEFSYNKEIEDRILAPVPVWMIGAQKIVSASIQALLAALVVLPVVLLVHAQGQAPHIDISSWPLFLATLVLAALLGTSIGLLLGVVLDVRRVQSMFALIMVPMTMFGCTYFPWSGLHSIRWLQILVLINPVVYMSEGLRAALTPQLGHLPLWAVMLALVGGTVAIGGTALKLFVRKVLD